MSQRDPVPGKKPYEKPEIESYSSNDLMALIGPARAIYGSPEGFPP